MAHPRLQVLMPAHAHVLPCVVHWSKPFLRTQAPETAMVQEAFAHAAHRLAVRFCHRMRRTVVLQVCV